MTPGDILVIGLAFFYLLLASIMIAAIMWWLRLGK